MFRQLVFISILFLGSLVFSNLAFGSLEIQIRNELTDSRESITTLQSKLPAYHIVFWKGLNNETIKGYFEQQIWCLQNELGVDSYSTLAPSSFESIKSVAARAPETLKKISAINGNKPLIVLAHSKGAPEALLTLLQNPNLVDSGLVAELISLNGAIGGSPLSEVYEHTTLMAGFILRDIVLKFFDDGIMSLRRSKVQNAIHQATQKLSPTSFSNLNARIHYVRAARTENEVVSRLRVPANILSHFGVNDGMILTEDQKSSEIGIDLGVLHADHNSFASSVARSKESAEYKRAFTRAVLREVL